MAIDPVTALLDIGGKVIDRLWPDPLQAAQAKLELVKLQQSRDLARIAGQMRAKRRDRELAFAQFRFLGERKLGKGLEAREREVSAARRGVAALITDCP